MTDSAIFNKELRKAWLKEKFASFEYHEELLRLHAQWLSLIKAALDRAERDPGATQPSTWFRAVALPNFEKVAKPGTIDRAVFKPGETFGAAIFIVDYRHDTGLEDPSAWDWMTPSEQDAMYSLWGMINRRGRNIVYTVDQVWDRDSSDNDWILDTKYTGPIEWPANWREQVELASSTLRVTAGRPAPRDGLWQSVDSAHRQQRARAGDTLPDLNSGYGVTVWEWIGE